MSRNRQTYKILFSIGATVLLIGLAFQWYPTAVINGETDRLALPNLTNAQRTAIQDSINWWTISQDSTFQPLSMTFFTAGILILIYAILSASHSLASDYFTSKEP